MTCYRLNVNFLNKYLKDNNTRKDKKLQMA